MNNDRAGYRKLLTLWRPALKVALAAGLLVEVAGCTRHFFRKRADTEVSEVLAQKDKYPDWGIENWHVYADPKARFADCGDPDHPPKPPDDPAAYALSPNPQRPGKAGVARVEGTGYLELIANWDQENRQRREREEAEEKKRREEPPVLNEEEEEAPPDVVKSLVKAGPVLGHDVAIQKVSATVASVDPSMAKVGPSEKDALAEAKGRSLLDVTGRPTYLLTLEQAAELAMFNSREYQDQRENLYLAALPVTQQRFAFTSQFFAAQEASRAYAGRVSPQGPANNWSLNNGVGFSKILPTGALLLLNFSNQTVFNFLNPKSTTSVSTLNFDAIQPLLRGGGEAVALESLTQAERNLLYQIRNYARFRKSLYVAIASSNGGAISGGSFQPSGVLSNSGTGGSGLGTSGVVLGAASGTATSLNGPIIAPNTPGALALANAITPAPSGYLSTMLQKIQVNIDQENIDGLSDILLRYRGLLEGGIVQPLQVQSVEQQLLAGRDSLLTDQQRYLGAIDGFKLEIGVPMRLNIEMDDSVLQPLMKQFRRSRAIIDDEHAAVAEASALIPIENAPRLRAELHRLFSRSTLVRGTPFAEAIGGRWGEWEKLSNQELATKLEALHLDWQKWLNVQADLQKQGKLLSPENQALVKRISAQIDLGDFEAALRRYERNYVQNGRPLAPGTPAGERRRLTEFQNVVYSWQKVLVEARDDRWDEVRASWPELERCCVDGVDLVNDDLDRSQAAGAQYALTHRLDLMNVRAQVVDAWRQLAVYANALLGTFTVRYNLSASSPVGGSQPLNIGGSGNAHALVLDTALPLVRVTERNNYRGSLIAYQRQRRALQEAEDLTIQAVNNELHLLRLYANQYNLQQRQLELAYLTIDSALEQLTAPTAPPPPVGLGGRTTSDGPAALTQQVLTAQRSLPTAQSALLTLWINYLNTRLQLYRDLELMPLDARGVWLDQIRDCDCGMKLMPVPTPAGAELLPAPHLGQ